MLGESTRDGQTLIPIVQIENPKRSTPVVFRQDNQACPPRVADRLSR